MLGESAKHRVSDSLSRLLRCTCQVYLPLRVLTPPPSFVIRAVAPLSVDSSPRAETVMCRLPGVVVISQTRLFGTGQFYLQAFKYCEIFIVIMLAVCFTVPAS